jgi:glycosyltransferase involved in cell wall biosynthesis
MRILHICNDFFFGKFYKEIFDTLSEQGVEQTVIIFLRKGQKNKIRRNIYKSTNYRLVLVYLNLIQSTVGRLFPAFRNRFIIKSMLSKIKIQEYHLIHAHTLYSNGSLALSLASKFNINYVVSVRNTDINSVLKVLRFHKNLIRNIVLKSRKVLFLSPSYTKKLNRSLCFDESHKVNSLYNVIPNPINNYFLDNIGTPKKVQHKKLIKILFVGEITSNKNIDFLLELFSSKWNNQYDFLVNIIGQMGSNSHDKKYFEKLIKQINRKSNFRYLGEIRDHDKLKKYYRDSDIFFMTSKHETFGIVYLESISQGTPIIYTKGEAVDGYFNEGVIGCSVKLGDISEAQNKVEYILKNYESISKNCISKINIFNKENIVKDLIKIYKNSN